MDVGWAVDNLRPLCAEFPNIKRIEFKEIGSRDCADRQKSENEPQNH